MWAGWVNHSWRFGHAESLCEVGPKMPERRSKTSTVPVVWAILEFFRHDSNDFLSWLVTIDESWLYQYDLETKQQSMEWRLSSSPCPKNSKCKNPLEKFSPWFFGIKTGSSSLNYQRGVLLISAGAIEGYFEGKTRWEDHQGGLVLAWQCPGSPGPCNPEETGLPGLPVPWSPTLFSRSGPIRLPPVPWTEKAIERSLFFVRHGVHCCRGDLVGWTTFWIFFWVTCKS